MFHKIKNIVLLEDYILSVTFFEGVTKKYDVKLLFKKYKIFNKLKQNNLFEKGYVGPDCYGVIWDYNLDISCDELFENGIII